MKLFRWLKDRFGPICDLCRGPRKLFLYDSVYVMSSNNHENNHKVTEIKLCSNCANLIDHMKTNYVKRDECI